jgi:hypothetical protein
LSRWQTSKPESFGIITSSRITSGLNSATFSSVSAAVDGRGDLAVDLGEIDLEQLAVRLVVVGDQHAALAGGGGRLDAFGVGCGSGRAWRPPSGRLEERLALHDREVVGKRVEGLHEQAPGPRLDVDPADCTEGQPAARLETVEQSVLDALEQSSCWNVQNTSAGPISSWKQVW